MWKLKRAILESGGDKAALEVEIATGSVWHARKRFFSWGQLPERRLRQRVLRVGQRSFLATASFEADPGCGIRCGFRVPTVLR